MHQVPHRGHRGENATKFVIKQRFHWPQILKEVTQMCKACCECNQAKIDRAKPQGLLQPVQTLVAIAQSYNVDLLGPFPESKNGNHKMFIVVDRFSRRVWLLPTPMSITSEGLAEKFVKELMLKEGRGLPLSLVSDNDTLFKANFWQSIFKHFGTKLCFATPRTQSTNGLAERYVAVVEEILRTRINYEQDDWEELIPHLIFALNNQIKESLTGMTPWEAEYGITPMTPVDFLDRISREKVIGTKSEEMMSQQPKSWAQQRIQQLCEKREQILEHIEKVKMQMKRYADERRRTTSALLEVGAWAYVQMPRKQVWNEY